MFISLLIAIILITIILVLQFNSFKQPLIILFILPLSLIGVIFGLTITRSNFSITAFIGVISLAGIVVNDAIVLISRINHNLQKAGMEFIDGIYEAARSRLQPIILTTLTTVVGLIPLSLANEMWTGLSVSIIFGLSFATFLTLIVVPSLYVILEQKNWEKEYEQKKLKMNSDN
jgi:HAE1 family hydrophobic/amphiphilic exporter-1